MKLGNTYEWVGLLEHHPEAFKHAMELEKTAIKDGTPFTWCVNFTK